MRKAGAEWRFLMSGGIWFQIIGLQTEKARFPNWVRVLMTTAALVVDERSWRRPDVAEVCWLRVACITVAILSSIRAFTGNQWRRCSAGLMRARWSSLRTSRAVGLRSVHAVDVPEWMPEVQTAQSCSSLIFLWLMTSLAVVSWLQPTL